MDYVGSYFILKATTAIYYRTSKVGSIARDRMVKINASEVGSYTPHNATSIQAPRNLDCEAVLM